jgi:hypothetical protein
MTFARYLMYGSILSPLLPIGVVLATRKRLNRTFLLLLYLILLALTSDIVNTILALQKINNLPIAHVYGLLEGLFLIFFFSLILQLSKPVFVSLFSGYGILYILNSIFNESIYTFNAYSRSAEALLMLILSVFALHIFYIREDDIFIEKSPEFWAIIAILFYFSGALFSFLLSTDMLSQSRDRFYGSWVLHNFSNVLKNVIFAIGLWKIKT